MIIKKILLLIIRINIIIIIMIIVIIILSPPVGGEIQNNTLPPVGGESSPPRGGGERGVGGWPQMAGRLGPPQSGSFGAAPQPRCMGRLAVFGPPFWGCCRATRRWLAIEASCRVQGAGS